MKPIGGFFELEKGRGFKNYHASAIGLANGRACFNLILVDQHPVNIYLPYYCCDTLVEPILQGSLKYTFYEIDQKLEPIFLPDLRQDELFLYINYFGLKNQCVEMLVDRYKEKVIIDDTQNYFARGYRYGWSFNSSRKFFGVPDGGYLYGSISTQEIFERNRNYSAEHLILRLDGRQKEAFLLYQKNEQMQAVQPRLISLFSETLLNSLDYQWIIDRRRSNFEFYRKHLDGQNQFEGLPEVSNFVPFCYPFLPERKLDLGIFYEEQIFIPMIWKEVGNRIGNGFNLEKTLSDMILPLPVDHRYEERDLERIVNIINELK